MSASRLNPGKDPVEKIKPVQWEDPSLPPSPQKPPEENRPGFAAFFLLLAKQLLDLFQELIGGKFFSTSQSDAKHALQTLQLIVKSLMEEDKSQDTVFLKSTAQSWQTLLKETSHMENSPGMREDFAALVQSIQTQPSQSERPLGYYLENPAKMRWIPFPYMELMHDLYWQHQTTPGTSLLTQWNGLIDKVLEHFASGN